MDFYFVELSDFTFYSLSIFYWLVRLLNDGPILSIYADYLELLISETILFLDEVMVLPFLLVFLADFFGIGVVLNGTSWSAATFCET